jgi:hypothetical protein
MEKYTQIGYKRNEDIQKELKAENILVTILKYKNIKDSPCQQTAKKQSLKETSRRTTPEQVNPDLTP